MLSGRHPRLDIWLWREYLVGAPVGKAGAHMPTLLDRDGMILKVEGGWLAHQVVDAAVRLGGSAVGKDAQAGVLVSPVLVMIHDDLGDLITRAVGDYLRGGPEPRALDAAHALCRVGVAGAAGAQDCGAEECIFRHNSSLIPRRNTSSLAGVSLERGLKVLRGYGLAMIGFARVVLGYVLPYLRAA